MNVLIYGGDGTSVESVKQTKSFLSKLMSPYYAVSVITEKQLLEEPWTSVTALLVIPGGADLPYCRVLNGDGNQKIKQYIKKGGIFLGLCAGGYYGASSIEFEKNTSMEVSGPRELKLYKGIARGTVFKGFLYGTDKGAHATKILFTKNGNEYSTVCYYNGGCLFEGDADAEVLARYVGPVQIDSKEADPAAIVYKTFGEGKVLLSGVHFEYDLDEVSSYNREVDPSVVKDIYEALQSRREMVEYIFVEKLGLNVSQNGATATPQLTRLHLTSLPDHKPSVASFQDAVRPLCNSEGVLADNEDVFKFVDSEKPQLKFEFSPEETRNVVVVHQKGHPSAQETPYFNHGIYFAELESYVKKLGLQNRHNLGSLLLYGEVLTSTSTILEKNLQLLQKVPHGTIAFGTQQTAGRGRGSNVWVNPIGVMAVSGIIRIAQSQCTQPLVFIQYIASLAVVRAINSFLPQDIDIGLRLKWPNDVYIKLDDENKSTSLAKIGGVIVSCNIFANEFAIVFGSGTNVDNPHPTMSANSRISQLNAGPKIMIESLLARFMTILDDMTQRFFVSGFGIFQEEYKSVWLHNNSVVTLEKYGNINAVVKGISSDTGMLVAEDKAGIKYELQPDGNSFDMLRGLICRKK